MNHGLPESGLAWVPVLGADQKKSWNWGRDCAPLRIYTSKRSLYLVLTKRIVASDDENGIMNLPRTNSNEKNSKEETDHRICYPDISESQVKLSFFGI